MDRGFGQDLLEGQRSTAVAGNNSLDNCGVVIGDGAEAAQFSKAADEVLSPGSAADDSDPKICWSAREVD
jgi:hypothetical protein